MLLITIECFIQNSAHWDKRIRLWPFLQKLQLPSPTADHIDREWHVYQPRGMEAEALKLSAWNWKFSPCQHCLSLSLTWVGSKRALMREVILYSILQIISTTGRLNFIPLCFLAIERLNLTLFFFYCNSDFMTTLCERLTVSWVSCVLQKKSEYEMC